MPRIQLSREPRRQVKIYLQRVFLPPPSPVLASIYSILLLPVDRAAACLYTRIQDVGLSTLFRFNVRPVSQPIAGSMPVNRLRCWPNTNSTLSVVYFAFSMLSYSFRRWPYIEIALRNCPVYAGVLRKAGYAFLPRRQKGHDVMIGHRLRRWANIIPTKTL